MKQPFRSLLLLLMVALLVGCGSGQAPLNTATGRAMVTVIWPLPSRLIPSASSSIRIVLTSANQTVVSEKILAKPVGGGSSSVTFDTLPLGSLTATATAYPQTNGSGVAQASGATALTISSGNTTQFTITMGSLIQQLALSQGDFTLPKGQGTQLNVTAQNAAGQTVLLTPQQLRWASSTGAVTVSNTGALQAQALGTSRITVTDTESSKSASVLVTVREVFVIGGQNYVVGSPEETLTALYSTPDGGVSISNYKGYVLVNVTGTGQSYGAEFNDAFYLYTGAFNPPQNGHDGGFYQMTFGTAPLNGGPAENAIHRIVGTLPIYSPNHGYTVILDTTLSVAGKLHFGVSDGGYADNTGSYTIKVTQLVPAP